MVSTLTCVEDEAGGLIFIFNHKYPPDCDQNVKFLQLILLNLPQNITSGQWSVILRRAEQERPVNMQSLYKCLLLPISSLFCVSVSTQSQCFW